MTDVTEIKTKTDNAVRINKKKALPEPKKSTRLSLVSLVRKKT